MTHHIRHTATLAVAICVVFGAGIAWADSLDEFKFTNSDKLNFSVGPNPVVSVETLSGDITYVGTNTETAVVKMTTVVRAADRDEAEEIREELDVLLDGREGYLDCRIHHLDDFYKWMRREFGRNRSVSVHFEIRGPRGAEGEFTSVSGDIEIENTRGVLIESVSGDVFAESIDGRLQISSVSGNVTVTECSDRVSASSVSGNVSLADIGGRVSASSTSGDVSVDHRSGRLTIETVSGDVIAESESDQELTISSVSGTVEVAIRPDAVGEVDLETFSGRIRVDTNLKGQHRKRHMRGRIGDGDGLLEVDTHSGDIILSQL